MQILKITIFLLILLSSTASASPVEWDGIAWNSINNQYTDPSCSWVDDSGNLHMKLEQINGVYQGAAYETGEAYQYGTFSWTVQSESLPVESGATLGFCTYHDDGVYPVNEIDIEINLWPGYDDYLWYTLQPGALSTIHENKVHSSVDSGNKYLHEEDITYSFTWSPESIYWSAKTSTGELIEEWSYSDAEDIQDDPAYVCFDLLTLAKGDGPRSGNTIEVVLSDFTYTPLGESEEEPVSETSVGTIQVSGDDIQAALDIASENGGGIIHLDAKTYTLDDTLRIGSNTILEGDGAVITINDHAGWPAKKPLISSEDSTDITIRGFEIDGNHDGNAENKRGAGYYNLIHFIDCSKIEVSDMYLHDSHGDGLKTDNCEDIKFHDNEIKRLGHDGLYASSCSDIEAYNNDITCRTNSGLRLYNSNNAKLHDNEITSDGSGGAGIEIQKYDATIMDNIEIYNNQITETALSGIWIFGSGDYEISTAYLRIYNNEITKTGTAGTEINGGILLAGFNALIENNVIEGVNGEDISEKVVYFPGPSRDGFVIETTNNDGVQGVTPETREAEEEPETDRSKIIEVSGLSGDDIQDGINKASSGYTVLVKAGTYTISKQLTIPEGVTLKGEMQGNTWKTTLVLADNANFDRQEPIIRSDADYVTICNLHLDGNSGNQPSGINMGDGYYNWIGLFYGDGHELYNLWIDDGLGDQIRLRSCVNVDIHDNKITRAGHEGIFLVMCEQSKVHDNYIEPRDNTAVRLWGGHAIRIYDNTVYFSRTDFEGNAQTACHAFQVQMDDAKKMSDIEICGNYVYGMLVSDVWGVDKTGLKTEDPVWIHHNVFENSGGGRGWGSGNIILNGLNAKIEHNVFADSQGAGVSLQSYKGAWGTEVKATISNNIFYNIDVWSKTGSGGYGIVNSVKADITSEDNCYYGNSAGNANGYKVTSSDYFVNPKTEDTECDIKWKGGKWVIPGVTPKEFGDVEDVYDEDDEVSDEEIDEFDSIFSLLGVENVEFVDTGRTEQTADDIDIEIEETAKGKITGGIKLYFKDVIYRNGKAYIPGEDAIIVKYVAIMTPIDVWWNGGISKIDKEVKTEIKDGIAYANLTITMKWYTMKENKITGGKKKNYHNSTAVFRDSCPAFDIWPKMNNTPGYADEYRGKLVNYTLVSGPSEGLTKIVFKYNGTVTTHYFMLGQRYTDNETGIKYTNFTDANYWEGDLPHYGDALYINGSFDPKKLHVEAYSPYESETLKIKHTVKEQSEKAFADGLFEFIIKSLIYLFGIDRLIRLLKN